MKGADKTREGSTHRRAAVAGGALAHDGAAPSRPTVRLLAASSTAALAVGGFDAAAAQGDAVYREGTEPARFVQDYEDADGGNAAVELTAPGATLTRADGALVVTLDDDAGSYWIRNYRDLAAADAAAMRAADPNFSIEAELTPVDASGHYGIYWGNSATWTGMDELLGGLGSAGDEGPGDLHDYALLVVEDGRYRIGSVREAEYEAEASGRLPTAHSAAGRTHRLAVDADGGRVELRLDGELLHETDAGALHGQGAGLAHGVLVGDGASVRVESYAFASRGEPASLDSAERSLRAAAGGEEAGAYDEALSHLRPLAEQAGDAHAEWRLAQLYAQGAAVERDYARALEWAGRAASAGYVPARLMLAELLTRGPPELRDGRRAIEQLRALDESSADGWRDQHWYRMEERERAAPTTVARIMDEQNRERSVRMEAHYRLGLIYGEGLGGVERDYAQARLWLEQPAGAGHAGARYALGLVYLNGHGIEADPARAVELLEQAAGGGHAMASLALGLAHAQDASPVRDLERAYSWFTVAANVLAEGPRRQRAERARASLAEALSAGQIERARAQASEWMPDD